MAEFVVTTDLRPLSETRISANFEEMELAMTGMLEPYKTMVVTEDGIRAAKADRAKINNVAKRIDEVRMETKRQLEVPIKEFEAKCNGLKKIASDASANLDRQIKGFEEAAKQQKLDRLELFWECEADEDVKDFVSFLQIRDRNPKWVNTTYSEQTAQDDIQRAISNCRNGLAAIRGLNSSNAAALLDEFRRSGDIGRVLALENQLRAMRKREDARKKAEAEARKAKAQTAPQADMQSAPKHDEQAMEEVRALDFRVYVTKTQLTGLKEFLIANNIKYGKVPRTED